VARALGVAPPAPDKYERETSFWARQIPLLLAWYEGTVEEHYRTPAPRPEQRIAAATPEHAAILTWFELHQKPKYLTDLDLPPNAFAGERVLDVGSGPMPSAECFEGCELYCLDPLFPDYLRIGYPLHVYRSGTRFVQGRSEAMPLGDGSVDAVVSVNAIDHVDDFAVTAREIGRVLRPGGRLRMHVHYHRGTPTEPQRLDDRTVAEAFEWCEGLRKIAESTRKTSADAAEGELFTLWSNF
jgi:SAM-dependent methyltransferase